MSWRDRLAVQRSDFGQQCPDGALTKLPEAPFVGFGSALDGPYGNIGPVGGLDDLRIHLLALADADDLPVGIVHRLHADDLAACVGLPDETLLAYLRRR